MLASKHQDLLGLGLCLMMGTACAASAYVNVVGATGASLSASYPATSDCTRPCGIAVGVTLPLSLTAVTTLPGADQTYLASTLRDAPVTLTAPSAVGNQIFSHWNGCDSSSGTYLNTCTTTTASAFKQVTAIYTNADSRIVNISTRAYVGTGEKVVILGFMISGGDKQVLIRGLGSSLETSGIYDCLKDPYLVLYQGSTAIRTNDDTLRGTRPPHSSTTTEAEINTTLAPGAYTAILQASPKTSFSTACPQSNLSAGIGLVSVEDMDTTTSPSRLVNISTRAYADLEGSSRQAIAGFVLSGTGKKRVLVKAVGSTLGQYGIAQPLQDPTIGFFSGANRTYALDNWRSDPNSNGVLTVNASPLHDDEAAFLMELSPGAYTVHMGASYTGYTQYGKMTGVGLFSIEEDRGSSYTTPIQLPSLTASVTIYKRGVQCETTTYMVSYLGPQMANLVENCPGLVISLCGASDQKIYAAGVTTLDAALNTGAGWSTSRPSCN